MSININIREAVANRLTVESFQILKEMVQIKPYSNGKTLEWFQNIISKAEATDAGARSIAATIVMKAYGEELEIVPFDMDRLTTRVLQGIRDALQ